MLINECLLKKNIPSHATMAADGLVRYTYKSLCDTPPTCQSQHSARSGWLMSGASPPSHRRLRGVHEGGVAPYGKPE